jgi:hypothetical protein
MPCRAVVFLLPSVYVPKENSGAEGEVEDGRKFGYLFIFETQRCSHILLLLMP